MMTFASVGIAAFVVVQIVQRVEKAFRRQLYHQLQRLPSLFRGRADGWMFRQIQDFLMPKHI